MTRAGLSWVVLTWGQAGVRAGWLLADLIWLWWDNSLLSHVCPALQQAIIGMFFPDSGQIASADMPKYKCFLCLHFWYNCLYLIGQASHMAKLKQVVKKYACFLMGRAMKSHGKGHGYHGGEASGPFMVSVCHIYYHSQERWIRLVGKQPLLHWCLIS